MPFEKYHRGKNDLKEGKQIFRRGRKVNTDRKNMDSNGEQAGTVSKGGNDD